MFADDNSETQNINYPLWLSILQQKNAKLGITMYWVTPLNLQGNAAPYLQTSPKAYTYDIQKNNKETLIETNPFVLQTMNTTDKEKRTLTVAAELTGKLTGLFNAESTEESHIIVIPDQFFLNTTMNQYIGGEYGDYRNFDFLTTTLLKLNNEIELAELQSKSNRDTSFYKITDVNQFALYRLIVYLICFILLPVLIIISGFIFYAVQKR